MTRTALVNEERDGIPLTTRVTTLRLPIALYEEVVLVANAEGKPVSEVIREAIADHIRRRRADPEFQARLKQRIREDVKILRRLEARGGDGGT